jgi:dihydrofolate reductase
LKHAMGAAKGKDVRLGGGVATSQEYLRARLVDELHLAISPVLLGSGEALLRDINLKSLGFECVEHVPSCKATHVVLTRR